MVISVVVPIYNPGRELLSRCIDSLLQQTHANLEVLLIDDGSTDDSGLVCDEYAQRDGRIKVVHKSNGGEASARNVGLDLCTGDYIGFCDSDDELPRNAIQELVKAASQPNSDVVVGAYLEKTGGTTRIAVANKEQYTPDAAMVDVILDLYAYGSSYIFSTVNGKLFRAKLIRKHHIRFQENMRVGNDTIFFRDYLAYSSQVWNIFLPVYIYYKYDAAYRNQGTAWCYPDWFLFLTHVRKKEMEIILRTLDPSDEKLHAVYQRTTDVLIGSLVKAAAYEAYFPYSLEEAVAKVVQSDFISRAVSYYEPIRIYDSIKIPRYISEKNLPDLMEELRIRGKTYIKTHGKDNLVRFIYSEYPKT